MISSRVSRRAVTALRAAMARSQKLPAAPAASSVPAFFQASSALRSLTTTVEAASETETGSALAAADSYQEVSNPPRPARLPTDQIPAIVEAIVNQHVDCSGGDWKSVQFANPSLKFKIVRDAMFRSGRAVTNVELSNLFDAAGLVQLLTDDRRPHFYNPFEGRNDVEEWIQDTKAAGKLPANITYTNVSNFQPRTAPPLSMIPASSGSADLFVRASFVETA
ncbi:hypothetical protein BC831DRAFT_442195 [Entophlyctis helioformis]|nr:hypothetical protein BC831DRAFT_442195 [Entophlyctis helioformis]